jgi:hypothetical protein
MNKLEIKAEVPYLSNDEIEARANILLNRYNSEISPVLSPPIPVEKIADFLLGLSIDWNPIPDTEKNPILAWIDPKNRAIRLNLNRRTLFDQYIGTLPFTYAHEIGHYELHLYETQFTQYQFEDSIRSAFLCRMNKYDRREIQANMFAGFLLMPKKMILAATENMDLKNWPNLYRLSETFSVSITALTRRLTDMGVVFIKDKVIYSSEAEANGQQSLF